MNISLITVKTPTQVKERAQEVAKELGFSLSSLVNAYLRQLVKTKTVHFSLPEEPTQYLLDCLNESKKDIKAGRVISFEKPEEAVSYLDRIIKEDEQSNKQN